MFNTGEKNMRFSNYLIGSDALVLLGLMHYCTYT